MSAHPIAIIGAGPQGLAAAAHLHERGLDAVVLERGDEAASAVREWGHVRLFSDWRELVDGAAARLLAPTGWRHPGDGCPTGQEWAEQYLTPLAATLGSSVHFGTEVTGVSRVGSDKVVDARNGAPFTLALRDRNGREHRMLASAVIDASGTWTRPNPAGADGLPALGEEQAAGLGRLTYRIPADASAHAGGHVVVIGGGHSAVGTVLRLAEAAGQHPSMRISWVVRRRSTANLFGGGAADALPERAALGTRARAVIDAGAVDVVTGFRVTEVIPEGDGIRIVAEDGRTLEDVAHVYALTGFRPDLDLLREVRTSIDPALEAVAGIAADIDPNIHSCGSVPATGAAQLTHPENGLFVVGAKSYGRAPTFLAMTGYEQVRSVAAHLAGDHEAARRNDLVLPETGVCGGSGEFDEGGCCAAPALLQIGSPRL